MSSVVFLNGEFLPRTEAKLSVDERGFLFGDGIYEVTRAVGGNLFESERHLKRMWRGIRELRLNLQMSTEEIVDAHLRLLRENALSDGEAYIYLQVTRGA